MLTTAEIEFILQNQNADTTKLLLSALKYQGIDVKLCVNCIEARKKLITKLPQWYSNTSLVYPFPLSAEQCSSQLSGEYKKEVVAGLLQPNPAEKSNFKHNNSIAGKRIIAADLTGGMGVDSYWLSQLADEFHYFERNEELCRATEYNFGQLGVKNVQFHNCEVSKENILDIFSQITAQATGKESEAEKPFDFIFIDPARRSKTDKSAKVVSLKDYEPNLLELKAELFKLTSYILVKVSPMADIKLNLELLPETVAIHVVSVDNECKELLFLMQESTEPQQNIPITTVNISSKLSGKNGTEQPDRQEYNFTFKDEENAIVAYTSTPQEYLYEPNKSLLKAGAFKSIAAKYGVEKLAPSTHLYTSNELIADFPGKIFKVSNSIEFNKKTIKNLAKEYPHADLSARNFPLNTNELKKLSGIKDGGNHHIFAVTLTDSSRRLIVTTPYISIC